MSDVSFKTPQELADKIVKLNSELRRKDRALAVAKEGLNIISAWSEGLNIHGDFDEPNSAKNAREYLEKIKSIEAGK